MAEQGVFAFEKPCFLLCGQCLVRGQGTNMGSGEYFAGKLSALFGKFSEAHEMRDAGKDNPKEPGQETVAIKTEFKTEIGE